MALLVYRDTDINRDYRGYYLADIEIKDDGPAYYWTVQADSVEGIMSLIDRGLGDK